MGSASCAIAEEARRGLRIGDTTIRIRKAAGSTASAQSTIVLTEDNNARTAPTSEVDGIRKASLLRVAAENSGRSRLSRSEARSAAATSTSSMLALSANARRWARTANSCCRNFKSCDEEPESSPQASNERALAAPATPVLMHHPTHSIYWGR